MHGRVSFVFCCEQIMDSTLGNPFSIVNAHGAFGSIPRVRESILLEDCWPRRLTPFRITLQLPTG